ncbi:MAG: NAD-dependent succinate-semialdehyde dehydrogenase [Agarilytica sp.]
MLTLQDTSLLRFQNYIGGQWMDAESGETLNVYNPATGEVIATVTNASINDTRAAIISAEMAMKDWQQRTAKDRGHILRRWFDLIMENIEDLAKIMTAEQGKPLTESRYEVAYGASFIEWFAEEGKRIYGDVIPSHGQDKRIITIKQAVGVVAAITPWNFPNAMITRKAGPALAAGCTIVIKPASETPLSALAIAELSRRAGLPDGVLNVVVGIDSNSIGQELTTHPSIRKVTFTGSTRVGKILMQQCASTVKKTSMELGGNAPFIVFDDADIDAAVAGAIASKFRNAGQTCVCANRILVQAGVYDIFAEKFSAAVNRLTLGDGMNDEVTIGPLIDEKALANVDSLVCDALDDGAKAIVGGKSSSLGGTFYEPTVLIGAKDTMRVFKEEIFGPIAPLFAFKTDDEAITMANNTEAGLAAYMYTQDINRFWRVSEALEYGIVGVNEGVISTEVAPFGGMKESGTGREGSKYGIEDYLELKYICVGGLPN